MTCYTLDSLDRLNPEGEKPARYCVIGDPVAHSLSPQLHQPALDALDLDARYVRVEVPEGKVPEAFTKLRAAGINGINVTVPHKLAALAACDEVDPAAAAMGAVNTIVFDDDSRHGFNTDGPGFVRAIREEFNMDLRDLKVALIGAGGGAGRAIATQCALEKVPRLVLANRSLGKIEEMKKDLSAHFQSDQLEGPGDRLLTHALEDESLEESIRSSDLLINTTSVGLKTSDPSPIPASWIEPHHLVYDTIYNPSRTRLLQDAEANGARIANGLSLLLHQGALSFEYWTGKAAPLSEMRKNLAHCLPD